MKDKCAVFGVYAPGLRVANLIYFSLFALQHRGQESSGIAVSDGERLFVHKDMGLVSQVFEEKILEKLDGFIGIGHNRYSTTGRSSLQNAQPFLLESDIGPIALAHNGNLTNYQDLQKKLIEQGDTLQTTSDSEIIGKIFVSLKGKNLQERLVRTLSELSGAFSVVISTKDSLIGFRDALGIRPLCLGTLSKNGSSGWVISSESCALQTIGADFVREVEPGEAVIISKNGVVSLTAAAQKKRAFCIFEKIYFMRPDSISENELIYETRFRMGQELARESFVRADGVMPIPDSSVPAAIGFAYESKLPFFEGLIKNRYIARTFIQPEESLRKIGVRLKFNPLKEQLYGKKVIVVDDSIVRGHTTKAIVTLLKESGAEEVHLRITSPPIRHPCNLGIDMATHEELIANKKTVNEICSYLGADSLHYLSLDGLYKSSLKNADIHSARKKFCAACLTGEYPSIPDSQPHSLLQEPALNF